MDNFTFSLENCGKDSQFSNDTGSALSVLSTQETTALVEFSGHVIGSAVAVFLYFLAIFQHCAQKHARQNGTAVVHTWDFSGRVHYIMFLVLANTAAFLISAPVEFKPWELDHDVCTAQAMMYHMTRTAIDLEALAMTLNLFLFLVKTIPLEQLHSCKIAGSVATGVYVLSAALAIGPFVIQVTTGKPIYDASHEVGYCYLSFEGLCSSVFVSFYVLPSFAIFLTGAGLLATTLCKLSNIYKHMRSAAKAKMLVYLTRRIVVLAIQAVITILDLAYVLANTSGASATGFYLMVSFLTHAPGLVLLTGFLFPEGEFEKCLNSIRHRRQNAFVEMTVGDLDRDSSDDGEDSCSLAAADVNEHI